MAAVIARASGTSIAAPGSRNARCMSTTSRAVPAGSSRSTRSKVSVRSLIDARPGSVQDVLLDVVTDRLVIRLPEEEAGRPVLDQGRDRVLGPLELHLPPVIVVEE